jgi:hypothetical protein
VRYVLATRAQKLRARAIGAKTGPKSHETNKWRIMGRSHGPRPEQKPKEKK